MNANRHALVVTTGVLLLAGCSGGENGAAQVTVTEVSTVTATVTATATETVTVEAAPAPTADEATTPASESEVPFPIYELEERFEFAESGLTVLEVTVQDEIGTTDGTAIQAADGEQLVLIKAHYENRGPSSVDLSCSGPLDLYIQAYDTELREMDPVFETHRIPGNQPCNQGLLSGQDANWNWAYRAVAGGDPMALEIVDTRNFEDLVVVNLTDEPLGFE